MDEKKLFPLYLGIFLVALATMSFELGLMRIFSISQWYHFAFMVISVALLGYGVSGTFLAIFPGIISKKNINGLLAFSSISFSISCLISYLIINNLPFDSFRLAWEHKQIFYLVIYYVSLAVPFFFSGLCLSLVLAKIPLKVNNFYFYNLIGSGLGCLSILVFIPIVGSSGVVIFSALFGMLATVIFSYRRFNKFTAAIFLTSIALLSIFIIFPGILKIKISPYKSLSNILRFPDAKISVTKRNSFSKVDVVQTNVIKYAPGLSYMYEGSIPLQKGLTIDGGNFSALSRTDFFLTQAEFVDFLPTAINYKFRPLEKALIINPGGGLDVLSALYHKVKLLTIIEENPLIGKIIKDDLKEFTGNIYNRPNVHLFNEGGRGFLRRTKDKFDLVQISLTGSFATVSSGVLSLREHYLYTREAFEDYLRILSDNGYLSITRWIQLPPSEGLKIGATLIAALENMGIKTPSRHIIGLRSLMTATYLVKKTPFSPEEIEILKQFCKKRRFDIIYFPGIDSSDVNKYNVLEEPYYYRNFSTLLFTKDRGTFYKKYIYNIIPPTDDSPFFFHFFKWRNIPLILKNFGKRFEPYGGGGYLMIVLLLVVALLTSGLFILLPLFIMKRRALNTSGKGKFFIYFFSLGLGYLFVEIPLMHKFILFLDHPIYAFSIVLFSVLFFSGLGSYFSGKFDIFRKVIFILPIFIAGYFFFIPYLFQFLLAKALFIRMIISLFILMPLSFMMGIPFPLGIRILNKTNPRLIPWVWGINGFASVISAILALMIACTFGYTPVLILAGFVYLVALGLLISFLTAESKEQTLPD